MPSDAEHRGRTGVYYTISETTLVSEEAMAASRHVVGKGVQETGKGGVAVKGMHIL